MRIINKQNESSVALVHGLFTNSGFWLPYIEYFREYRVYLIDIDYNFLSKESQDFDNWLSREISETKILNFIGHSFGATFLQICTLRHNVTLIGINPAHLGMRRGSSFAQHVSDRYGLDEIFINNQLNDVYDWVYTFNLQNSGFTMLYTSDNDEFFDYSVVDTNDKIVIESNHFNIDEVFVTLTESLTIKNPANVN